MDFPSDLRGLIESVFGPVVMSFMNSHESAIIKDFSGVVPMTAQQLHAATYYCVCKYHYDYLMYFIDRTNPQTIMEAGAISHDPFHVDLAVARGATYTHMLQFAARTGNLDWVHEFVEKGARSYQAGMLIAMRYDHENIVQYFMHCHRTYLDTNAIVAGLSECKYPVQMLWVLVKIGIDLSYTDQPIDMSHWNAKTQCDMVHELSKNYYNLELLDTSENPEAAAIVAELED